MTGRRVASGGDRRSVGTVWNWDLGANYASGSLRLLLASEEALEDRLGDSLAVDRVRPALDALSQLLHFVHRTVLGRERCGRALEASSTVASRTRHPSSRHVSGIQHRHVSPIVLARTMVHGVGAPRHAAAPRG